MVLQPTNVPFTFSGGLNSKIDEFQLTQPQLLQADNVRFTKDGAIDKRTGFIPLSRNILGGGILDAGVAIQFFNDELLAFDGTFIYSFIESQDAWINRGNAISLINSQRKIETTRTAQQGNVDGTNLNGIECYIWEDNKAQGNINNPGIRYSVLDSNTGSFIVSDRLLYSFGYHCKILANPNTNQFNIYYQNATGSLAVTFISIDKPEILLPVTPIIPILTTGNASSIAFAYDACMVDGQAVVAFNSLTGIQIYQPNTGLTLLSNNNADVISIYADPNNSVNGWWIVYSNTSGTFVLNVNTLITTKIDTLSAVNIAIIEGLDKGTLSITYEINPGIGLANYLKFATFIKDNDVVVQTQIQRKLGLASKPFKFNNQIYINTIFQSTRQSTYFTLCLTQNLHCVSKINPQVGGTYRTNGLLPQCDPFLNIPGQFMFANQKKGAFQTNNNLSFSLLGLNASYLQFTNDNAFNSLAGANNLHIVGGVEKIYDGVSIVEDNFHLYAEVNDGTGCTIQQYSTGGLSTGQYQYCIVYEWADNNNAIQRGQPSVPTILTTLADGYGAKLTIPTLTITDKNNPRSPVSIAVYRTVINLGVPSSIFYKITDDTNPLVNDTTKDFVTFIDVTFDKNIQSNEPLYTTSQLFNSAPPSCSLISNYATRLMLSGLEDPNVIWVSQDRFQLDNYNTIPIEFSPLLIEGVDPVGGKITAIRVLDESMVIFKSNTIFIFSGEGPNANATSGQFTNAVKIPSDTGCVNPNSIIEIPANQFNPGGLMYQSEKGIYLFDRGHNNSYIGKEVEKYNDLTITSCQKLDRTNEIIFLTAEGTGLCYNYLFGRWTTWSYIPSVDSCIWKNNLLLIQSDGTILQQQDGVYTDYASNTPTLTKPIIKTVQLPWLSFAGLQGFQSVFHAVILGHYASPHLLNISVCYDGDPSPREPVSINSNMVSNVWGSLPLWGSPALWGAQPFTPYQFQYNFADPWCSSLSMIITDSPLPNVNADGYGHNQKNDQGVILSAISFSVGLFSDTTRLPAKNRVSGLKNNRRGGQ